MATETVLTRDQIDEIQEAAFSKLVADTGYNGGMGGLTWDHASARAIEQAVLQSPEVQRLRKDAEQYQWLKERGVISFPQSRAWMTLRIVHPMPPNVMTLSAAIDAAKEKKP